MQWSVWQFGSLGRVSSVQEDQLVTRDIYARMGHPHAAQSG